MELQSPYQADVTEVEQAEWSGGDSFSLDEVLQDVRGRGLDVTVVLTHRQRVLFLTFLICTSSLTKFSTSNLRKASNHD